MSVLDHKLARSVDEYIDEHHDEFSKLGKELFDVFGYDRNKDQITQIRNLQQVACSAVRFADIEDFVKNQMGKTGNADWKRVGESVLQSLNALRRDSANLGDDTSSRMSVRLKLARSWARAVVSEYLYQVALKQMEQSV